MNGERVNLVASALWLRAWLALGLIVVLGVIVGAVRRQRRQHTLQTTGQRVAAWEMIAIAVSWLAFYVTGIAWQIVYGADAFKHYPQPLLVFGLRLVVAAVALTALGFLLLPLVYRGAGWSLARRVRHTLVLLVLLGVSLALQRWNVIGFHYF